MSRIDPHGSVLDVIVAMAEGNPGAANVLISLAEKNMLAVLMLDQLGIYGSNIWLAYKDVCGESLAALDAALMDQTLPSLMEAAGVTVP